MTQNESKKLNEIINDFITSFNSLAASQNLYHYDSDKNSLVIQPKLEKLFELKIIKIFFISRILQTEKEILEIQNTFEAAGYETLEKFKRTEIDNLTAITKKALKQKIEYINKELDLILEARGLKWELKKNRLPQKK